MGIMVGVLLTLLSGGCARRPITDASHGQTGVLHLHATWNVPWCSGVEPDPSEWPRVVPWSGTMYLRKARPDTSGHMAMNNIEWPILDSILMDSAGHGHLSVAPGSYLLLDRARVDRREHDRLLRDFAKPALHREAIDRVCLDRWLKGPFEVITISAGDTLHLEMPLQGKCSWQSTPCAPDHGPPPP